MSSLVSIRDADEQGDLYPGWGVVWMRTPTESNFVIRCLAERSWAWCDDGRRVRRAKQTKLTGSYLLMSDRSAVSYAYALYNVSRISP